MTLIEKLGSCMETMVGRSIGLSTDFSSSEELKIMRDVIARARENKKHCYIQPKLPVDEDTPVCELEMDSSYEGEMDEGMSDELNAMEDRGMHVYATGEEAIGRDIFAGIDEDESQMCMIGNVVQNVMDAFWNDADNTEIEDVFSVLYIRSVLRVPHKITSNLITAAECAEEMLSRRFELLGCSSECNVNVSFKGTYLDYRRVHSTTEIEGAIDVFEITVEMDVEGF